jgi:hypothetical protein
VNFVFHSNALFRLGPGKIDALKMLDLQKKYAINTNKLQV